MPCHAMPCNAMPYHAVPCHTMPCHAIPYHTTHLLTHSLTYLLTHSLTHSFIHSFIHPFMLSSILSFFQRTHKKKRAKGADHNWMGAGRRRIEAQETRNRETVDRLFFFRLLPLLSPCQS